MINPGDLVIWDPHLPRTVRALDVLVVYTKPNESTWSPIQHIIKTGDLILVIYVNEGSLKADDPMWFFMMKNNVIGWIWTSHSMMKSIQ
jgi:hypothetical protein